MNLKESDQIIKNNSNESNDSENNGDDKNIKSKDSNTDKLKTKCKNDNLNSFNNTDMRTENKINNSSDIKSATKNSDANDENLSDKTDNYNEKTSAEVIEVNNGETLSSANKTNIAQSNDSGFIELVTKNNNEHSKEPIEKTSREVDTVIDGKSAEESRVNINPIGNNKDNSDTKTVSKGGFKIPIRFWIAVMIFATTYINYTTRSNISISITSMVSRSKSNPVAECKINETKALMNSTGNQTIAPVENYGPRYDWSESHQALIIGSYFWGYVISSAPGGFVAEWLGPFNTIFYTQIITGIFNSLCVWGATWHFGFLIFCRFVMGVMAGAVYPACQCLIAKWAPPAEKGKFVSALMGNTLGTCLSWISVGVFTSAFGWDWGFHNLTAQIVIFCLIFFFVAADSPDTHKWISEEEKNFIKTSQAKSVSKGKAIPPYFQIFTSLRFWALAVCHFGNLWGLYLQITGVPKFMVEVIGYNIKASGGLAALPHLLRMFMGMGYGYASDYIKQKNWMSTGTTRRVFALFSHVIPGCLLMCMTLVGCNPTGAVLILIFSMSINGAAVVTNLQNAQDLAPNFAGSIFGIISLIGGTTGFITPFVTGALLKDHNGIKEWSTNFIIGGCVYVACGVFFILFMSSEIQPWNEKKQEDAEATKEETVGLKETKEANFTGSKLRLENEEAEEDVKLNSSK